MSGDARPQAPDDDGESAWRPSASLDRSPGDAVSGIRDGFGKVIEGGSEAAGSVVLLVILLLLSALGEDDDENGSKSMTPQEKAAEWDAHTDPIQKRFEENDVDEEVVEDAIAWARSQD